MFRRLQPRHVEHAEFPEVLVCVEDHGMKFKREVVVNSGVVNLVTDDVCDLSV